VRSVTPPSLFPQFYWRSHNGRTAQHEYWRRISAGNLNEDANALWGASPFKHGVVTFNVYE